jgi:hypothetical protein
MRKMLGILAAAGLLTFAAGTASAQGVNVRIGVGEPGHHRSMHERPVVERRYVERRRMMRPSHGRMVCRTVVRERVNFNGRSVRRPTEVCRRSY